VVRRFAPAALRSARLRLAAVATATAALAGIGPVTAASAAPAPATTAPTTLCSGALSHPFTPWSDAGQYTLAPGADFEGALTGWSLTGGAALTAGSESFAATGSLGSKSLTVPVGATVVTPDVCIDPTRETFRFFARNASTSTSAKLKVEILYPTRDGTWKVILGGIMDTARVQGWQLSPIYSNSSNLALLSGQSNPPIRYRFTAAGGGWQIDDVFVDPYRRG
jgi:hypothetical protein